MKNISYFADFGSDARTSGGPTFARELFKILDPLPINLTTFASFYPEVDKKIPLDSPRIVPVTLPFKGTFGMPQVGIPWALKLRRLLIKMPKQDLYIFDQPQTWLSVLPQAPAIAMFHGSNYVEFNFSDFLHPRSSFYALVWEKPVLNRIQKKFLTKEIGTPIFNSHHTLGRICADFRLEPNNLEKNVLYLPVDTDKYKRNPNLREKTRKELGIRNDEIVILYLSNFSPAKQAQKVPPIVKGILSNCDLPIKFLFVGRKISSAPIDKLCEDPKYRDFCIRIGEVPPEEVSGYYSSADIAISTSKEESFGYFVAEGMAAGLPYVAYPGGAIKELIKNGVTGFLVDSEEEFVAKLGELIRDKNLCEGMGLESKKRINEGFSIDAFRNKFLKVLEEDLGIRF